MSGAYQKEKQELLRKADELDKLAETSLLSQQELNLKQCIKDRLAQLMREEEIKWFQRIKTRELLEGDDNTKYFQMIANGKTKKKQNLQVRTRGRYRRGRGKVEEVYHKILQRIVS